MRVVARKVDWSDCPIGIASYTKRGQTFLTVGRAYEVHAVAVFRGFPALQVVDDLNQPSWEANWLFDIIDTSIPDDWICNAFEEDPILVLGPDFVAHDRASYGTMVDLEAEQVNRFWRRVEARQQRSEHEA